MNIIPLIILFCAAFILQYLLTFVQMKSFNTSYRRLRQQGLSEEVAELVVKILNRIAYDMNFHIAPTDLLIPSGLQDGGACKKSH